MALRTAAPRGLRRFFSTSVPAFNFPPSAAAATQQLEQAERSTNLFISGKVRATTATSVVSGLLGYICRVCKTQTTARPV